MVLQAKGMINEDQGRASRGLPFRPVGHAARTEELHGTPTAVFLVVSAAARYLAAPCDSGGLPNKTPFADWQQSAKGYNQGMTQGLKRTPRFASIPTR